MVFQVVVFVGIMIYLYLHYRRYVDLSSSSKEILNAPSEAEILRSINIAEKIYKDAAPSPVKVEQAKLLLETVFPTWAPTSAPHEILGVATNASASEVEAAYKTLLKKYHPDRFSAFGRAYELRAHHVLQLAQKARDTLLKGRS